MATVYVMPLVDRWIVHVRFCEITGEEEANNFKTFMRNPAVVAGF